jgi:hypothetical protein
MEQAEQDEFQFIVFCRADDISNFVLTNPVGSASRCRFGQIETIKNAVR